MIQWQLSHHVTTVHQFHIIIMMKPWHGSASRSPLSACSGHCTYSCSRHAMSKLLHTAQKPTCRAWECMLCSIWCCFHLSDALQFCLFQQASLFQLHNTTGKANLHPAQFRHRTSMVHSMRNTSAVVYFRCSIQLDSISQPAPDAAFSLIV
jgi:hypothetical protein